MPIHAGLTQELKELTYRIVFEESSELKFIIDHDGIILNANNAFAEGFGKHPEDCLGLNIYSLLPREVAAERKKHADEAFMTGQDQFFEDDSNGRFFRNFFYPVKEENGTCNKLYVFAQDVTEVKLTEKQTNKFPAFSREAMEAYPGPFVVLNPQGDIITSNSCFRQVIAGKEEHELPGVNAFELIHPDCRAFVNQKIANILQNGTEESAEIRIRIHDGADYGWFRISTKKIVIDDDVFLVSTGSDITVLKNNEQELGKSKARLAAALESMNDALFIFDAENQLVEYNTAYTTFLRFSDKTECMKRLRSLENFPALFDVSLPDGTPAPLEQWAIPRALRGETCTNVEYHVRRTDTGQQWIGSYNFAPIRNNEEKIIGAVTTARDITQHKKAEAALKESEERFRKFFEQHSALMMILDPETGNIIDVNHSAAKYYGWSREQFREINITNISTDTPKDALKRVDGWRNAETRTFTVTHRKADGSICDIEVFGQKIRVQERWLAYLILHDITERKQFQQALVESSERMNMILKATNAGIWDTDATTFESTWSNEIWGLYGLASGSCTPSFEKWINTIVPEDQAMVKQAVAEAVNNATEYNCSWRVSSSDGTIHWLMSKGNPIRDAGGNVVKYVGITLDITERKREEEERKHLEARIRRSERLETIGTLAGGIAHDFNNILTPILGYAEIGMMKLPEDDELYQYLTEIKLAAERARNLVYQILTFGKTQESEPSVMSMQSIIDEALKLMRPSIPAIILIEPHIDSACRNILADPSKIHQVIVNLCTNAYQAMEDSGGFLRIELKEVVPDSKLRKCFRNCMNSPMPGSP